MTDKPTPTDAELDTLLPMVQLNGEKPAQMVWLTRKDARAFSRAVLAKWGQPAQAAEPVARLVIGKTNGGVSLTHMVVPAAFQLQEGMYALYTAPQPVAREQLTPERVKEIVRGAGYDQCGIPDTERAAFINGLRHGEREHGIKGGQHVS